ncbi:MAG TPA: long-chain fatty acid--CoA ligase [Blastocatellia bacterium]|nr:long-chain fatty acid--CoA ligase [Blastocatellia bacterium]
MMQTPLTMRVLMERAALFAPDAEVVSKMRDTIHRYTYAEMDRRGRQLANALVKLGIRRGDRVASLAWNSYRHLELYYAVPCMGAVLHTLNLRLAADQLAYVINHAEDSVICVDEDLLPILEKLDGQIPAVKHFIVMSNTGKFTTKLKPAHDYEQLIAAEKPEFAWPELDENSPMGLCYTSGTTGNPKGAMYTHRSNYLHTITQCLTESMGIARTDTVMAVVPMFHANAWGLPYACCMLGVKQVFPGPTMDGASICRLIEDERVTFTAGVPTIWMGVKNELESNPGKYDLSSLKTMVCGGSAPPRALIDWFETKLGIEFHQAWGMTETSPLGSVTKLKSKMKDWPREKILDVKQRCGIIAPGLEARIVDDNGNEAAHDGVEMGRLLVRGPWIASEYYKADAPERFPDGWFDTGDIATIDAEGYIAIADRAKDVIKSGGEWISSVDMENAIMAIPGVAEAAVIGVNHPRWQERPLACVVVKPGEAVTKQQVLDYLASKFAKWWLPDEVLFIDSLPKTSVGKFDKKVLRAQFADYELPG